MIGEKILRFKSIESTNDFLKVNSKSLANGTIVVSEEQTNGRGRSNHLWISEKGNLYFSFLIKDDVTRMEIFKYIANTSVAIIRLLRGFRIKSEIKYPNDILVEDKKICGILIESYGSLDIKYLVVGVGINVNQQDFKGLNKKATSIKNETNKSRDLDKILNIFIQSYNDVVKIDFNKIFKEYIGYSVVIGKNITNNKKTYLIKGIHKNGNLILENDGKIKYMSLNEISLEELY